MTKLSDTERFLQEIFREHETRAIFANIQHALPKDIFTTTRKVERLDLTLGCYWSVGIYPDDRSAKRTLERVTAVVALVIDDVGPVVDGEVTKIAEGAVRLALGQPTAIIRTSPGNHQWTYRLSRLVPRDEWPGFFAGAVADIGGRCPEGGEAIHVFWLPQGVHPKPEHNGFKPQLVELNAGVTLDVSTITPIHAGFTRGSRGAVAGDGSDIKLGLDELREFMSWIPNTFGHRQEWMDALHDIKALCKDDEDGFTVADEWSDPEKYPGYNRVVWKDLGASGLKSTGGMLKGLAQKLNPDGFAKMFAPKAFDDGAVPPPVPPGRGRAQFNLGANNEILKTLENTGIAIDGLGIACRHDQFHHRITLHYEDGAVERLTDDVVLMLRVKLNSEYAKDFGDKHVGDAIKAMALGNGFNPVVDMLAEAEAGWDGVKRLDRLGPDYFHTEDTPFSRAAFRKTMLAAVRRARRPGCKFDQILVVESPEGWDKSSAWAVLAGEENFSDASILGKDARAVQEELGDVWIHEIADLSGLARAEVEAVKAFASRTNDRARPAYGRFLLDQPRQSIEVGTTNADAYLLSPTGNRRFWPCKLSAPVDLVRLRADRMQIWGEAARAESGGETLVLDRGLWGEAERAQEERRVIDPWEDELANLPDSLFRDAGGYTTITNVAINDHLGGHRGERLNGASGRKISEIMKRLGWERSNHIKDAVGKEVRGYRKRTDVDTSVSSSVHKNVF